MIREIAAKTLVTRVRGLDSFFGLDYGMNLYRGCQHRCIYCDSRSLCYGIDRFDRDVLVKANAIAVLRRELSRKRRKGIIGTGSMSDSYMPLEETTELTRRALGVIAEQGFGVHVVTKSDLVLRDIALLKKIGRVRAVVSLTITTPDDDLARLIEPGAPVSSVRFRALRILSHHGIETRIALMPSLPFIEDDIESVRALVEEGARAGVKAIVPWFGVSLRDRQRDYFYSRLEELFPGTRDAYETRYKSDYFCPSPRAAALTHTLSTLCEAHGIATVVRPMLAPTAHAERLFP